MYLHYYFLLSVVLLTLHQVPTFSASPKHYIIYLGAHHAEPRLSDSPETITNSHHQMVSSVLTSDTHPSERLVYSYNKFFNAFAATLFEEEANELAKHPSVVSVFESREIVLHTTRSADFLGLPTQHREGSNLGESVWEKANFGEDIIIGAIDNGIWPESKSFSDKGYGPIPKKFKGFCANENDPAFKCNRKLIGARYFVNGLIEDGKLMNVTFNQTQTPRHVNNGHGSHVLSIAGGNIVPNASWKGMANGTAKGMAPRARLAMYRNLWEPLSEEVQIKGNEMDLLASFEGAIEDGVDIINLSEGSSVDIDEYFSDVISLGTFFAMKNGILTVAGAGNDGPTPSKVFNIAPWILTVAASTIDREFTSNVVLGNNQTIKGIRYSDQFEGLNIFGKPPPKTIGKVFPLITGAQAGIPGANISDAGQSLDLTKLAGKYVVCLRSNPKEEPIISVGIRSAGGVGVIFANTETMGCGVSPVQASALTSVVLCYKDAQTLFAYINSTRTPTALVTDYTTSFGIKPTPVVGPFSSRGPNLVSPEILKPDVIAPGVDILGAGPPRVNEAPFYITSGTSQATPHVAGIAALIKKLHPDWHTAAIKSAIMTTASPLDNTDSPILDHDKLHRATPFAIGSGHVRPHLAIDPGLVYDMNQYNYLNFLCTYPHNITMLEQINKGHFYKCPQSFSALDFNYPSISIINFTGHAVASRKLKNVGHPGTYVPRIEAPQEVTVTVEPKSLVFTEKDQIIKFKLVFTADHDNVHHLPNDYLFGSLVWSDGKHVVRSPIVLKPKIN